jgi:hypothetical protein
VPSHGQGLQSHPHLSFGRVSSSLSLIALVDASGGKCSDQLQNVSPSE